MQSDKRRQLNKKLRIVGIVMIAVSALLIWAIATAVTSDQGDNDQNQQATDTTSLSDKVTEAIDALDDDTRQALASTSADGYQGDVVSVEPAVGDDTVKVNVSTRFTDAGDEPDGGRNIARAIFGMICTDVPELGSLYVVSGSGLESQSVYRSQIPACN